MRIDKREHPLGLWHTMGNETIRQAVEEQTTRFNLTDQLRTATIGIDLGSGYGQSTLALLALCPNLLELYTVDDYESVDVQVVKAADGKIIQCKTTIAGFLEPPTIKADIIFIVSAPDHQLKTPEHYQLLSDSVSPNGILITLGDTRLNIAEVGKHLNPILTKYTTGVSIWKKEKLE